MLGKATDSILKAGALGSMVNASTYGRTIALIYGTTRAQVAATWAANLRTGASSKKSKKKGVQTYVENIDFLIGHNPIGGPLQMWDNANTLYPLEFEKYTHTINFESWGSVTVPDDEFYAVVAVTQTITYSADFDDYGGQGSRSLSGSFEIPMWNAAFNGPDPVNTSAYQNYPYAYYWLPGSGPTVTFPFYGFGDGPTVNVYYAKLSPSSQAYAKANVGAKGGSDIPISALRLSWEPQLGDGDEYGPEPCQQIIYPFFAGMGSSDIDLGASGAIPNINPEIWGMFPLYPDPTLGTAGGDADFADMITDILTSGPAQAGLDGTLGLTAVMHGCNCNGFPGIVQRKTVYSQETAAAGPNQFDVAVQEGDFLVIAFRYDTSSGAISGISDTMENDWTEIFVGAVGSIQYGAWYCQAKETGMTAVTVAGASGDHGEMQMFDVSGYDTIDSVVTNAATSDDAYVTISSTTPRTWPALVLTWFNASGNTTLTTGPRWQQVMQLAGQNSGTPSISGISEQRRVWGPATVTNSHALSGSDPWAAFAIAFKNTNPVQYPTSLGNILDPVTMANARLGARAGGLWGSIDITSSSAARDILGNFYKSMNAAPVYSGFVLKSIAWSEVSAVGNGAVFVAPTASGPIASLGPNDFIGDDKTPPGNVGRKAEINAPPILSMQHYDRANNYNQVVTTEPNPAGVAIFGVRKASPEKRDEIQDPAIARTLLNIATQRQVYLRNSLKYKLNATWTLLEPMDLVLLSDPQIGVNNFPVRITSVEQDDQNNLDMTFEPFVYGCNSPTGIPASTTPTTTAASPYRPAYGADPGSVNTPIFIEAVPRLGQVNNQEELWIVLSSNNPAYGGAIVNISTDGGDSYQTNQNWVTQGSAITGYTTGDWPAHADPDTVNNLPVNLSESAGELASYTIDQEDAFAFVFYVAGGNSTIPYELGAYAVAVLTSANNYTLEATGTGNELRRAVWGAPAVGEGVDHPNGSRFAFLGNPAQAAAPGIVRIPLDPAWVGVTLYFKFQAFNTFNSNVESLDDCTAYTFEPTGLPGGVNPYGLPPGLFTVNNT